MEDKATLYQKKIQLKNLQRQLNKDFKEQGLTDEILERQVELNRRRHELDIPDELEETLHEEYVQ